MRTRPRGARVRVTAAAVVAPEDVAAQNTRGGCGTAVGTSLRTRLRGCNGGVVGVAGPSPRTRLHNGRGGRRPRYPRGDSRGKCRCGQSRRRIGGATAADADRPEGVASMDVATRAAVGDVAAAEVPGGKDKRDEAIGSPRTTLPPWTRQVEAAAQTVVEAGGCRCVRVRGEGVGERGPEATGWLRRSSPLRMGLRGRGCVGRVRVIEGPPLWTRSQDDRGRACVDMAARDGRMGCCRRRGRADECREYRCGRYCVGWKVNRGSSLRMRPRDGYGGRRLR